MDVKGRPMEHDKPIVTITIAGPVQRGKSTVLFRIEKMLKDEFGATVVCLGFETERSMRNMDHPLADWERELITKTEWHLQEVHEPPVDVG
jgi:Ni2+-binding GTPase involved in maturation of urease and hydrogenase